MISERAFLAWCLALILLGGAFIADVFYVRPGDETADPSPQQVATGRSVPHPDITISDLAPTIHFGGNQDDGVMVYQDEACAGVPEWCPYTRFVFTADVEISMNEDGHVVVEIVQ